MSLFLHYNQSNLAEKLNIMCMKSNEFFFGQIEHESGTPGPDDNLKPYVITVIVLIILTVLSVIYFNGTNY